MQAARLYGPRDLRVDDIPEPAAPGPGQALIRVTAVGVCGSDLHMYVDGRIGDTAFPQPLVLGHEFAGEVLAVGSGATDGTHAPLQVGQRVAVDPAIPDEKHELYEQGHPNLVPAQFYGLYPDDGALQERMLVLAKNCFPMPDAVSDGSGALLETLGVAIHALDLAKLKLAHSVAVIGCGPVGLLIQKLAQIAGADPVFTFDKYPWRVEKSLAWGATHAWVVEDNDQAIDQLQHATNGRGVDVVFEVAWADDSLRMAAEMSRLGGRLVLVGIPGNDTLQMPHSTARRKGLTIMMSRRMKHTYPRALRLAQSGRLALDDLVSHHMPLAQTPDAFRINERYNPGVHKIIIDVT